MKIKLISLVTALLLITSCVSTNKKPAQLRIGQFLFTEKPIEIDFKKDNQSVVQQQMKYTELSTYKKLPSGTYTIEVKLENKLLLQKKVGIGTNGIYTLILYGIPQEHPQTNEQTTTTKLHEIVEGEENNTSNGNLPQLKILNDEFECAPDEAKIRWIHLAAGVEEISAEATSTEKTVSLSSLTYPKITNTKALAPLQQKINWKLKGSKVKVAEKQLSIKPQLLYTAFILGIEGKYIDSLKVVTGETPKKKF
ncbi:DUF4397 domain-containing protein [Mesonia aestuariivivens]|uniref:DUF4397 domain-containing protein n=1 Tax=Mesonia aestuariivivens TaxID=2796128 RepID=A0ABS6W151_9FLAO|nr:DUF4397 domain-containing protein [Mesonia aestuariivivens]MBW2961560.1 DUF4397 domain-containing protein [Mesonia aestuariivivens]